MARIHILGASGSGTTTLGKSLSQILGWKHYDTDDFYWKSTNPPFQESRERSERIKLLKPKLEQDENWILSGSLCGWGDVLISQFDIVIFLWVPQELRMERLRLREANIHGDYIHTDEFINSRYKAFMKWAREYDDGEITMRSRKRHEEWIKGLSCKVLRFEGDISIEKKLELVLAQLEIAD